MNIVGGEKVIYIRYSLFYSILRLFYLAVVCICFFDKTDIIGIFCTEDALNFWLSKKVLK